MSPALLPSNNATNVSAAGAVMNSGDETIAGAKTFSSTIVGSVNGNAGTVTNGVYTTSSVTDLSDVTSVGSGAIITATERTKLSNAVINTGNETIAGTKTFYFSNHISLYPLYRFFYTIFI